jgi:hypothetical protein
MKEKLCRLIVLSVKAMNWRFGRSYCLGTTAIGEIKQCLRGGMVILCYRKYTIANWILPGFWTHAALVVDPDHVVEATGDEVTKTIVDDFLSGYDQALILKPVLINKPMVIRACKFALDAVGSPYNYSFQENDKAFYCSQFICRALSLSPRKRASSFLEKIFRRGGVIYPQDICEMPGMEVVYQTSRTHGGAGAVAL